MRILCALLLGVIATTASAAGNAPSRKIVCWTDEKGQRSCGDRVPPRYAKTERQVFDASGRVVGTQARELNAEEIAERDRRAAEEAAEAKRRSDQAAYDQYLLQAYGTVQDLERTRKDRLDTLDGRIAISDKSTADAQLTLDDLRQRAAAAPEDAALKKQLADYERSTAENRKALASLRNERKNVCEAFARDIRRFEELKNLTPGPPADCEPAARPAAPTPPVSP